MLKKLREGITTGTCATAALKAALMLLQTGLLPNAVGVATPQGRILLVNVDGGEFLPDGGACSWTIKDGGDDIDITHGAKIHVHLVLTDVPGYVYLAGEGVGIAKKAGLFIPVGEAAINLGPRKMMEQVLQELLPAGRGAKITISVPGGAELAKKTLNPMLGIEGGISIIGTTGIVRPMSEESFKNALLKQYDVIRAADIKLLVLVPGKIGGNIALTFGIEEERIAQISNFAGFMLEQAVEYGFSDILVFGHIGKLIKLSGGIFHTHSKIADGRQEIFAAYLSVLGTTRDLITEVLQANTTERIMELIKDNGLAEEIYPLLAERAAERCRQYVKGEARVGVAIVDISGRLLGMDENAKIFAEGNGWALGKSTN